jgi:general secretion pathway protein G
MNFYKRYVIRVVGSINSQPSNALDNRGYTLVELIIVAAVLAILAAMAIPAYNDYVDKTKSSKAKADIRTLCTEINAYIMDNNGTKPANLGAINRLGLKDAWGRDYVYSNIATLEDNLGFPLNKDYDVYSLGKDGLTNNIPDGTTQDDIVNYSDGTYIDLRND